MGASSSGLLDEAKINHIKGSEDIILSVFSLSDVYNSVTDSGVTIRSALMYGIS